MLNTEKVIKPTQGYVCVSPVRRHHHRHNVKSRYEFIKTLGKGTYGKVKLARHKETQKLVAVKAIKKDKIKDSTDMKHIRREMEIMSSIQHPHIIQIYEVFENQDKIVIVMEYATGGELYDYLASKRGIPDEEAQFLFRQIVSAVRYCHNRGIVHRDLKLENILLNEDHQIKIADFGLANSFKSDCLLQTFCGSPLYASPEIVCGVPYKGPEVDSWSLGVLLYALVYGTMPFDGRNFQILTKQITSGVFCKPTKNSEAFELIRWMLTVDPKNRATIEDIAHHKWVNAAAHPVPVTSPPPVGGDAVGYDQYLKSHLESEDCCQDQLDTTLKACEQEEAMQTVQPKGILKRKTPTLSTNKPVAAMPLLKNTAVDNTLAGQLAAVCGLQAKDSLKLKVKPQGVSGKRRVLRSKRDRESGYYSSPERVTTTQEKIVQSDPTLHTRTPPGIPQIKPSLATPGRLSRLHSKHPGMTSSLPPKMPANFLGGSKDCYLTTAAPPPNERLLSVSSDDGSSIGSQTRPVSTYSDSSILSSDSFDICTFDGSLMRLGGGDSPTVTPAPNTASLSLSLVPDTLPPLNDTIVEEQAPGSLTPKSEKLVRDLQRILAPSGRRNRNVTKRPQSLDETSQLSTMMDQLNNDLELAYKKAIDICATLKSEV